MHVIVFTHERSQLFKVMKFWNFGSETCGGFLVADFLSIFSRKIGFKFVTENFTAFFTASKDICHLELTLGASSPSNFEVRCNILGADGSSQNYASLGLAKWAPELREDDPRKTMTGPSGDSLLKTNRQWTENTTWWTQPLQNWFPRAPCHLSKESCSEYVPVSATSSSHKEFHYFCATNWSHVPRSSLLSSLVRTKSSACVVIVAACYRPPNPENFKVA